MDPLLISALITGLATVAGNLLEKRVLGPALDTTIQKVQGFTQSDDNYAEGRKAVEDAISAAINDAMRYAGETGALQYFQRIHLHEVIEKAAIREEMMRLVFLATSDDPTLVPDALLDALHLNHDQRPSLANLLFYLHRRLNALPDFQPLLEATRDQAVVTELKGMARDLSALAGVIDDGAMRVRLVEPTWNPEPYLRYLANECNRLRLSVIDPQYVKPSGENRIALIEVYTDLEVTTPAPVKQTVERRHVGKDEATLG
ncbi:MAG: hypothetical protein HYR71_10465, partial [Chloroflexi bacterium]|nr:hypothetical protein [Chloroflexota bacterium]